MTRSKMALRFAVRALFSKSERPYFWTFTTRECVAVTVALEMWNRLQKSLYEYGKHPKTGEQTIIGLRCFELHPGGHGVHVHCLLNRRLNIHAVRRRCRQFGFGWIHVVRVRNEDQADKIADYMGKYMSKEERPECFKGRRLWAAIGKWGATRCKDIEIESEFIAAYRARRLVIAAEAAVARIERRAYRIEHSLETMAYAKHHCWMVKTGQREGLTDCITDVSEPSEPVEVTMNWKDWDAAFNELLPDRQQGPGEYLRVYADSFQE